MNNVRLGYHPDRPDNRDRIATFGTAAPGMPSSPPNSLPRMDLFAETLDQGRLASCVSHAVAQAVRFEAIQQLLSDPRLSIAEAIEQTPFLSRLFAYYFARASASPLATQHDWGCSIRDTFRVLNLFGFPPEASWPYDDEPNELSGKWARMPSAGAMRDAFDQRSEGLSVLYSRLHSEDDPTGAQRIEDIKKTNANGQLVVFGTQISDAFTKDRSAGNGKPIDPPGKNELLAGGHAMCWGGYTDQGVWTLGSWGPDYADNGWFLMSWDYVVWSQTRDLWRVDSAPPFSPIPHPNLEV